jgi:hypothetical protein
MKGPTCQDISEFPKIIPQMEKLGRNNRKKEGIPFSPILYYDGKDRQAIYDDLVRSRQSDGCVKSSRCKARNPAPERDRWTFYEAINL